MHEIKVFKIYIYIQEKKIYILKKILIDIPIENTLKK